MNTASEKFYDRLTFLYPVIDLFLKPQKRKFFREINAYQHGSLLEIGVGNGMHSIYYDKHDITGIDTSHSMLSRARRVAKEQSTPDSDRGHGPQSTVALRWTVGMGQQKSEIRLFHMNAEALAFPDETFDYVVMSHVIAVVECPEKILEEAYRVLKPKGKIFILNHFTPDNWLKYVDNAFEKFSRLFYFKSVFSLSGVRTMEKFKLLQESNTGLFSYYKILIYEKNI